MYALALSVLIVFAVIGIIYTVREITYFLFRNKVESSIMLISPIGKDCENAEYILRGAAAKIKWISREKNDCVICLDCDMDEETKKTCKLLCDEYGFIKLVTKSELLEILKTRR